MSLQVIGAGLGRTGTSSLKIALERLLGGRCYHMTEVLANTEHTRIWRRAAAGDLPHWGRLFEGYCATVDWPAAAFWPELVARYPEAVVVLSIRDPDLWWESASSTVFKTLEAPELPQDWKAMFSTLLNTRWNPAFRDRRSAIAAYWRHYDNVVSTVPANKLVIWQPHLGWEPLCSALGKAVPAEPFPHVNSRSEWQLESAAPTREQRELELEGA